MLNHSVERKCNTKISHLNFPRVEQPSCKSVVLSSFYTSSHLEVRNVLIEHDSIHLYIRCFNIHGICPYCGSVSHKVHSKYYRTIVDLPILGKAVTLHMESRKFLCPNEECKKKTFAEQHGNEVFRYRRRTRRCEILVTQHGLYCSSNKAKALLKTIGVSLCNTTILRDIHRIAVDEYRSVENIGVDDWAFRKGVNYGSIIINLDTGLVIDLLGDRNQDSFETWLKKHQKIGLASRDRSTEYSAAISSSGMNIIEVADRFHLVKNMSDCITKVISENYADYRAFVRGDENQPVEEIPTRIDSRQVMFNEVKEMQIKEFKIKSIANRLGIARQTVRKYMSYDKLPIRASKTRNEYYKYDEYVENEYKHGDLNAVLNSIEYDVSNGIVEGYVNKLKEVKRTMYGRAQMELLKRKMVVPNILFN